MGILTDPNNYDVCISISALVLMLVIIVIHSVGEFSYGKQSRNFGGLIIVATLLNVMGLIHILWIDDKEFREIFSYDMNCLVVVAEKVLSYLIAFFSMIYLMTLFGIQLNKLWKKLVIIVPSVFTALLLLSGIFTDFFYYFDERGEIVYFFPNNILVNIGIVLYLVFALYLIVKYKRILTSEKTVAIYAYYVLMVLGIPMRIMFRLETVFGFCVALSLLLCVFTFQNPSEFVDRMSGIGTKNALNFAVYTKLIRKKTFTLMEVRVDKLLIMLGSESVEAASDLLR